MIIENFLKKSLKKKLFPGISLLAGNDSGIILNIQQGRLTYSRESGIVSSNTIYDLASMTKPLITAFLTLYICEKENISLNAPVRNFFSQAPSGITLQNLLTHSSGIQSWFPLYLSEEPYIDQIFRLQTKKPGNSVTYSCLGFIILKNIIERVLYKNFSDAAEEIIFRKLKLKNTFINPPERVKHFCAPTECGNVYEKLLAEKYVSKCITDSFPWRTDLICGEPDDCNSWYDNGCSGNAGLFSTTEDIYKMTFEFYPDSCTILKPETVQKFWENLTEFSMLASRSAGFKLNSSKISSGGRSINKSSIGHNGFTGTSFWLEPQKGIRIITLTNRIHPSVSGYNFNKFRRKLHKHIKKYTDS